MALPNIMNALTSGSPVSNPLIIQCSSQNNFFFSFYIPLEDVFELPRRYAYSRLNTNALRHIFGR
jgi:hypothetical protein